jgi:transporter family protein
MSWHLLITLHIFIAAIHSILVRNIARKKALASLGFVINAAIMLVLMITGLIILPTLGQVEFGITKRQLVFFFLGGLGFALSYYFTFQTFRYLESTIASILNTISVLFSILFAFIILGERLSNHQLLGFVLLLPIIWYALLLTKIEHRKSTNWLLGLYAGVFAGILYGLAIVNEKNLLLQMTTSTYVFYGWGFQTIMAVGVATAFQRSGFRKLLNLETIKQISLAGISKGVGGIFFILSLVKSNSLSLMTILSNVRIILIPVLAIFILRERQNLLKKITVSIATFGALAIIFWN